MTGFKVIQPGLLSLFQDAGRFGRHAIGLTTGGPLDSEAMHWANRLVHNEAGSTALEISFGGLEVEVAVDCLIALTGGDAPLSINGREGEYWRSYRVRAGDRIKLDFARRFCRSYLAVSGGFQVAAQFGSTSSVLREGIGGNKLAAGDLLPVKADKTPDCLILPHHYRPQYCEEAALRVIPGYQCESFSHYQRQRFYNAVYRVTERSDRMGYRLEGPAISCDFAGILSEGICLGAIQIPADGQPIVLLQDRQTIGGYPKLGSALSLDSARMAQLMPGASVRFEPISHFDAHNALLMQQARLGAAALEPCNV